MSGHSLCAMTSTRSTWLVNHDVLGACVLFGLGASCEFRFTFCLLNLTLVVLSCILFSCYAACFVCCAMLCRHGVGVLLLADGVTYIGEWDSDLPHGVGVEIFPDGSVYKGTVCPSDGWPYRSDRLLETWVLLNQQDCCFGTVVAWILTLH